MKTPRQIKQEILRELPDYGTYTDEDVMDLAIKKTIEQIQQEIKDYPNPYPKDVFQEKDPLYFTRGRFNRFMHNLIEDVRMDLIKLIVVNK